MPRTRVAVQMALTKTEAFETLGVSHNERLDADEIKSAYRQASKRLHPDRVSDGDRERGAQRERLDDAAHERELVHDGERRGGGEEHAEVAVVEREARRLGGRDAEERDDLDHHEAHEAEACSQQDEVA